jgi:hypothetical protein
VHHLRALGTITPWASYIKAIDGSIMYEDNYNGKKEVVEVEAIIVDDEAIDN